MQKVSLRPRVRNILQVGRAWRAKAPISHPPKTPNLPPPRGRLTQAEDMRSPLTLLPAFLLFLCSSLLAIFSSFSLLPLSLIYSRYTESHPSLTLFVPYFLCSFSSLFISYSGCVMPHSFCHSFVSSFPSFGRNCIRRSSSALLPH